MYQIENSGDLIKNKAKQVTSRLAWVNVGRTVFFLGLTSFLTDISAEMMSTTLPLYLLFTLRLTPMQFGVIDGLQQGAAALVRLASGVIADRWRNPKGVAVTGYAFSALCKLAVLLVGGNWRLLSGIVILDRIGKGIRTPPRDAMIAASSPPEGLATAFGVHRAMDTAGAMLGPLLAAGLLALTAGAYDAVFVVSFCIALIGVAVITLFVGNPAQPTGTETTNPLPLQAIATLWRIPDFRRLLIVGPVLALMTVSDTLLYLTLQRYTGLSDRFFPLLFVATALIFMLLAVPVGRLADRLGRGRIFVAGYVLLSIGYGLLLTPLPAWAVIGGVLLFLGLYYAATDGVLMALISEILPADRRTTGIALLTTGTGLARLAASSLYGLLWGWRGANTALLLFLVGLVVAVGVTIVVLRRLETGGEAHDTTG